MTRYKVNEYLEANWSIKWVDKIHNKITVDKIKMGRILLYDIQGDSDWIYLEEDWLLATVLEGTVEGEKKRGRRKLKLLNDCNVECYLKSWNLKPGTDVNGNSYIAWDLPFARILHDDDDKMI